MLLWRLYQAEYSYRRRYEPARLARRNAARAALYTRLRLLIDWLEPPTATSDEWRKQRERP